MFIPLFISMNATGTFCSSGWGRVITWHSLIPSIFDSSILFFIVSGWMLNPNLCVISLYLPVINIFPSSSIYPLSPVCIHILPSLCFFKTLFVSFSLFRYSFITVGPVMHISPSWLYFNSLSVSFSNIDIVSSIRGIPTLFSLYVPCFEYVAAPPFSVHPSPCLTSICLLFK